MKRSSLIIMAVLSLSFWYLALVNVSSYSAETKAQVTEHKIAKEEMGKEFACPLCGMKVKVDKKTAALDYKGKTYYFCSSGEKIPFSKNPEKYISQESSESVTTATAYVEHTITSDELGKEATCPVTNKSFKIAKDTPAIDYQGKTYYFCCPGCVDKFMASQTASDSLKTAPDSLHHDPSSGGGAHKHKGCC